MELFLLEPPLGPRLSGSPPSPAQLSLERVASASHASCDLLRVAVVGSDRAGLRSNLQLHLVQLTRGVS
eukprot:4566601-Pyramimonas_sp.AAC.1